MPARKCSPPEGRAWSPSSGCAHERPSLRVRRKSASLASRFSFRTAKDAAAWGLYDGEALAPLQATALQHVLTGARRHPRAEAVLALARDTFGLPGSLD